jgi:4-amino-4-deoxy-L-arabinose transferase-like glycosyltransferase
MLEHPAETIERQVVPERDSVSSTASELALRVDRRPRLVDVVLITSVSLFTSCLLLGKGPLAGTEGHRVVATQRMIASGDWLIPRLYDQLYLAKPPLLYWIIAAAQMISGRSGEFIWRLPSAVGSALTAIFLLWITARWFGRVAGLVAGLSCCALVALWGQNRTAEIDSLNTQACVVFACLSIELQSGGELRSGGRKKFWVILAAAVACAAALMLKGPAGITLILASLLGPPLFNQRNWRGSRAAWLSFFIGLAVFLIYPIAVWFRLRALHESIPVESTGVAEIGRNLFGKRLENLPGVVGLPFTMFGFMLPMSISLIFALRPAMWKGGSRDGNWRDVDQFRLRSLVATLALSCGLTMVFGMSHERYCYLWVPMICPVAGAVAAARERDVLLPVARGWLDRLLGVGAILFGIAVIWLTHAEFFYRVDSLYHIGLKPWSVAASFAGIAAVVWILLSLKSKSQAMLASAIALLIAATAVPYAALHIGNRYRHSTYFSAIALQAKLPPGTKVTTGNLLKDQPELFYYSGMDVESYPGELAQPMDFPTSRWLVLSEDEYQGWVAKAPARLTQVQRFDEIGPAVVLAWYEADPQQNPPKKTMTASILSRDRE